MGQVWNRDDEPGDNHTGNIQVPTADNGGLNHVNEPSKRGIEGSNDRTNGQISPSSPVIEPNDTKDHDRLIKMNPVHQKVQENYTLLKPIKATDFMNLYKKYCNPSSKPEVIKIEATGDTYKGDVVKGVPQGWGQLVSLRGDLTEGYFQEGKPEGFVRRLSAPTGAGYSGQLRLDKPIGKGLAIDEKGYITECNTWKDGLTEGTTTITNPKKEIVFSGLTKEGKKNGQGAWKDEANKTEYIGIFVDDFLDGPDGEKKWENGQVYKGSFKKGVEDGKGSLTFVDGRKYFGPFVNGKAHGQGTLITDLGAPIVVQFREGKRI